MQIGKDCSAAPDEAAALLRVKVGFLCHQLSDQFFGSVNRDLIAYRALYLAIPLNRLVDVYALVAHKKFRICVGVLIAATFIRRRSG
jgi:hypothetical protein